MPESCIPLSRLMSPFLAPHCCGPKVLEQHLVLQGRHKPEMVLRTADDWRQHQPLHLRWVMLLPFCFAVARCIAAGRSRMPGHHSMSSADQPAPPPVPPSMLVRNASILHCGHRRVPSFTCALMLSAPDPQLQVAMLSCIALRNCSSIGRLGLCPFSSNGRQIKQLLPKWAPCVLAPAQVQLKMLCAVTCRSERLLAANCSVP